MSRFLTAFGRCGLRLARASAASVGDALPTSRAACSTTLAGPEGRERKLFRVVEWQTQRLSSPPCTCL